MLPLFIIAGYILYSLGGILGGFCIQGSSMQMIFWQVGNMGAICSSVMAGSLLARDDWHLPSAGFIILGIAHGIFFSSMHVDTIDVRIFAMGSVILAPAIFFINFYPLVPIWVKIVGWITSGLFLILYYRVLTGVMYFNDWSQTLGYTLEEITLIIWSIYLYIHYAKVEDDV